MTVAAETPKTPAEKRREKRANAAAQGLCGQCTIRPVAPKRKWCAECLATAKRLRTGKGGEVSPRCPPATPARGDNAGTKPKPVTVSSVFEPFAAQLKAIDWRDPVKREAEVAAVMGQMFVAVALAPSLTDADREKLDYLQSLGRQMVAFRDASAIEAARRALAGTDEPKPEDTDGPQLEPIPVVHGPEHSEGDGRRTRQTFRGRPRARAFS